MPVPTSGSRRPARIVARTARLAALLVVATAVAALAACSGSSGAASGPPTDAEIRAVLAAHGKAVLDDEPGDFLAGVSDAAVSKTFRSQQQAQFVGLAQLPIASWSYSLGVRTDDKDAVSAATKRYGTAAVIAHVVLHYALREVDPAQTMHDLYFTFIRQNGKVVIAGDQDLAASGGLTWKGPWDFGPLLVISGKHSLVIGHPAQSAELTAIATAVDSAAPAVTAVWGQDWSQQVAVLVPASTAELEADSGPTSTLTPDVSAETVSDGADPLSHAAYGVRLIVNPGALNKLSPVGVQIVLRHEITHIAAGAVTSDSSPRWLVEGFADYVGQLHVGQKVTTIAAELTRDVRAGHVPTALPQETTFDSAATSAQAYEEGWLACRLIAKDVGQAGLLRFYRAVGDDLDALTAVPAAFASVLHTTTARFTQQWRAYLRSELG